MSLQLRHMYTALAAAALLLWPARPAQAQLEGCDVAGLAQYQSDGTVVTLTEDGRWLSQQPGALEPELVRTDVPLECPWFGVVYGAVSPDGTRVFTSRQQWLRHHTRSGSESLTLIGSFLGGWFVTFTSDMRAVIATSTPLWLHVESSAGSNDYPSLDVEDNRCMDNPIHSMGLLDDHRLALLCSTANLSRVDFAVIDTDTGGTAHDRCAPGTPGPLVPGRRRHTRGRWNRLLRGG